MSRVRVSIRRAGIEEIAKSPAMARAVDSAAEGLAARAQALAHRGRYSAIPAKVVGDRQTALVVTDGLDARIDNAYRNTLLKAKG